MLAQERAGIGQLALATDEWGRLDREVRPVQRLERWELLSPDLVEPLWLEQVFEAVLAELGGVHVDEVSRGLGKQHLPAVPRRANAGTSMDIQADVALIGDLRLARVHPDADADRPRSEPALDLRRRSDRIGSAGEGGEERVALGVDLHAVVVRERRSEHVAVLAERVRVGVSQLVEQARRPLDVAEEEGDRPGRELSHRYMRCMTLLASRSSA